MLKIWGRTSSSNVQKLLWFCAETGIDHERMDAGLAFGLTKTPEYLAMNPNALIPTINDDGFVLWESNTILRYLAQKHQCFSWYPQDLQARAVTEKWMDWSSLALATAISPIVWQFYRTPPEQRDQKGLSNAATKAAQCTEILDAHLASTNALGQAYVTGHQITLADLTLGIQTYRWFNLPWASFGVTAPSRPALQIWYERLTRRQAFAQHIMIGLS
jgi:glutathione S-transferase